MTGKTRALQLGGASALAITATLIFMPVEANACVATSAVRDGANVVDIVCAPGDDAVFPFLTSYSTEGPFSDGNGSDTLTMTGGSIELGEFSTPVVNTFDQLDPSTVIEMLGGDDIVTIHGGTIGNAEAPVDVYLGDGADIFNMTGGTINGVVNGQGGGNTYTVSGGTINRPLYAGSQNDNVTISGTATIQADLAVGPDAVALEDGDDIFNMTGGTLGGSVSGGNGNDVLTISGGTVADYVSGNDGVDQISISGGTITGNVEAESVHLTGGTIGGDISGIGPDTLIIDDTASPDPLNLRNGVVISGTNANGSLTNTDLAAGGTKTQVFTGFNSLTADNSTLGFGPGTIGIALLSLGNGSTLFVNGNVNLAGALSLTNSAIDMVDGAADDVFTLGGLTLNNARIGLDVNQQTVQADQIVAGTFTATGTNIVTVNLLGTPVFTGQTDIPIIVTNGPVAGTFLVEGAAGTPGALFTYQVVAGPDGGLFIRAIPANFGLALAAQNAIDVSAIDTAIDALYGINDDAIDADLGLANSSRMVQLSPTFGVFASGQFAHVEHDGFEITNNNLTGAGPSFDANDFSAAISFDFNAAKHFGFDDQYGLNLGLFAGYASTDVGIGAFQGFNEIGDADNRSGMFGGYGLFRKGYNYALISASAFLGETDVNNQVLNTIGSYDTEGYAVTGSIGRIFALNDRLRFDLRGGLLGVTFSGGDYVDSGGNQFGKSRISFGAVKFEPGIYADYQLENGMVFSPYARGDFQQRFGYKNTSSIDGREIDFDDADFSVALSGGFNLRMSETSTISGEVRGKVSSDSSTVGGKLGLKVAF